MSLMIVRCCVVVGVLLAAVIQPAMAQTTQATPSQTIQKMKEFIDQGAVDSICRLMAEHDGSGPLSVKNYDAMRTSMEALVPLWRQESFSYGSTTIDESKQPARSLVNVQIVRLKQSARFTLLRFNAVWYIADIEIVFY